MKTDKGNIDELLKQQFENFAPDAPDVWNAVAKGIKQPIPQPSAAVVSKTIATAAKTWIVVAGIVTVAATLAVLVLQPTQTPNTQPEIKQPEQVNVNATPFDATATQPESSASPNERPNVIGAQKPANQPANSQEEHRQNNTPQNEQPAAIHTPQPAISTTVRVDEKITDAAAIEPAKKQYVNPQETLIQKPEAKPVSPQQKTGTLSAQDSDPFIPNVITPNSDGLNDAFIVEIPDVAVYRIKIVSSDNQVVYESTAITEYWNGIDIRNGENCKEGTYVYVINYQTNTGESKTLRGTIKLLRD
ncbi:MAG: gliding motility-associated C-terminal domain-containing protein [Bacteroidota bacterium]|jgi:gliding motility-associated-like protein